jgi:hypothetical protein
MGDQASSLSFSHRRFLHRQQRPEDERGGEDSAAVMLRTGRGGRAVEESAGRTCAAEAP